MPVVARHVSITGRVQGVFFRVWAQEQAGELAVAGWVRNSRDGRVDLHIEGKEDALAQMVDRLRRGPPAASVENVRLWDVESCGFDGFEVRH